MSSATAAESGSVIGSWSRKASGAVGGTKLNGEVAIPDGEPAGGIGDPIVGAVVFPATRGAVLAGASAGTGPARAAGNCPSAAVRAAETSAAPSDLAGGAGFGIRSRAARMGGGSFGGGASGVKRLRPLALLVTATPG